MQAGPCVRSNQLDYDEDVMYKVSSRQHLLHEFPPLSYSSLRCRNSSHYLAYVQMLLDDLPKLCRLNNIYTTMFDLIQTHGVRLR